VFNGYQNSCTEKKYSMCLCVLLKGPPGETLPANYTADDLPGTPGPPGEKGDKVNSKPK